MGCDIHCYIEYKSDSSWRSFGGRINPVRNYWLFGAMGGVRTEHIPFIKPRGFDKNCGYEAFGDNTIYICETQEEDYKNEGGDYYYSRKHAEDYVAKGYCEFVDRGNGAHWVTDCDNHSHSWLSTSEFELSIAAYLKASGFSINTPRLMSPETLKVDALSEKTLDERQWALSDLTEYWAILKAMLCFEAQGKESRLVFWFDN